MKTIKVVAAVIKAVDEYGKPIIFATQRGYGKYKDGWEFPGGKVEIGENDISALKREIKEELDVEVAVNDFIMTVEHDYPDFHLSMNCYFCEVISGELILKEHESAKWLTSDQLDSVDWLAADVQLVEVIKKLL